MLTATVGENNYQVNFEKEQLLIDNKEVDFDLVKLSEGKYHVLSNNTSFSVELVSIDKDNKKVSVKVNNTVYQIALKDKMDALLRSEERRVGKEC